MASSVTSPSGLAASTATTGTGASKKDASDRTSIAHNFDAFLLLLTTQLKNQSPLDPLDTNQFTQQLVQFASVEQQLKSNATLNSLLTSSKSSTASTAADFVGMTVTADGSSAHLSSAGKASWTINPARNAAQATLTITDKTGSVVATQTKALEAGKQSFAWDGRTSTGALAPEGDYTLTVTGRDVSGQTVAVKTEVSGVVDSVDLSGDGPVLVVGASRVPLASVKSIARPAASK